jgi:hypothetical protein
VDYEALDRAQRRAVSGVGLKEMREAFQAMEEAAARPPRRPTIIISPRMWDELRAPCAIHHQKPDEQRMNCQPCWSEAFDLMFSGKLYGDSHEIP